MRSFFIIIYLALGSFSLGVEAQELKLQAGDFLFQNVNCGPLCDAINAVTKGFEGRHFSHVGMVVRRGDSLVVIEARGKEVQINSLSAFLSRSGEKHLVARLKDNYKHLIPEAIAFSKDQLGVPYDDEYLYDNGKYYCSELLYDAFKHANGGQEVFHLYPMTYKAPGSDTFFPEWAAYFAGRNMEVPEGQPGCNPAGLTLEPTLEILGDL